MCVSRSTAAYTHGKGPVRSGRMYSLHLTVSQGSAPICKASAGPCLRCPPSTSGRTFGSLPSVDRIHSRPGPSTEGVLQTLPALVRSAQRSVRLEAVRGNKQEKTNKSSEQPAVSRWLQFCRHQSLQCFNFDHATPMDLCSSHLLLNLKRFVTLQTTPGEQNFMSQSSGYLSGIVNDLLYGVSLPCTFRASCITCVSRLQLT